MSIRNLHKFVNNGELVTETLTLRKKALRKEMKLILSNISLEEKQRQSQAVFQKLISLPQYQRSKRISIFLSTKDEIDTMPILNDLFSSGKEVFVPRYGGRNMEMVKLTSMQDYEQLPLTKWNIKQPSIDDVRENAVNTGDLDLICLPGLAFTKEGKRLGHGMGYYDKFLQTCIASQTRKPHLVALAFNEQIRNEVPTTKEDIMLNMILTQND